MKDFQFRALQASQGSKGSRVFQDLQVYQVLESKDGQGHQAPQGCRVPRGSGVSDSRVSRASQAHREKMVLWDPKETLDSKDKMELQELQDKMEHQDPKVTLASMVYPVQLVPLDPVFLELPDL